MDVLVGLGQVEQSGEVPYDHRHVEQHDGDPAGGDEPAQRPQRPGPVTQQDASHDPAPDPDRQAVDERQPGAPATMRMGRRT